MGTKNIKKPLTHKVAKTPVVMQLEALECGAASLAMVLAYYEKWVPLEQARVDCGVSRDGSSAKNIYKAAVNYGLEVEAYKFEVDEIKKEATFPCIIHWNFNHFVVLNGFKGNYAIINDPGQGRIKVPMEIFDASFTGVCLLFKPGKNFKPSGEKRSVFTYVAKRAKALGPMIIFGLLISLFTAVIGLFLPALNMVFYDYILVLDNAELTLAFMICMLVVSTIQVVLSFLTTLYNLRTTGKFDTVGSSSYMWKVLHLPMRFYSQRMSGDIVSRKSSNATISKGIVNMLSPLFINAVMMIVYFVIMLKFSWQLTIIALVSVGVNFIFSQIIAKKRMNSSRISLRDASKLSATEMSGIEMIETIKASGAEDGYFGRWAGYQASVSEAEAKREYITTYYGLAPEIISSLCSIVILSVGLYLTIKGEFTLGMITCFQGYLSSFLSPVDQLISTGQQLQEMQTSVERLNDVMEYPTDPIFNAKEDKEQSNKKLSGEIVLKNVTFGYSNLCDPLIENFSMTIKPGQSVAFVGSSGCGKSTLAKLVTGLEEPWSGEILFDGLKISEIDRSRFTSSVAVVDQDIIVFNDTIRNNIKMYDNSIEDFAMILAANDAQIHEGIMQRVGGYDYLLSSGGKNFSGGERQRLEIARVLAQEPTICILDEATSALDAKTEHDVVKAIKERNITTIVIAHRLSTIRDCDEIIVLDHGKVVERGNHKQLMDLKGHYSKLINAD